MVPKINNNLPNESDIKFYRENGYWISRVIFSDEELDIFRKHYYQVLQGVYETGIPPYGRNLQAEDISKGTVKITNCFWSDSALSRLILDINIGMIASNLMRGKTIRYWRDHLWYKPPQSEASTIVGWHQDYYYWQCAEPASNLITAWIALDDVEQERGCIEVIPGSHKWGLLTVGDLYSSNLDGLQKKIEETSQKPFQTVPLILPAGAVSFHNCLTIHGSRPNRSSLPRIGISVHLFSEGLIYRKGKSIKPFSNEQLLSGNEGDLFLGPHFPIVYRENYKSNPWQTDPEE